MTFPPDLRVRTLLVRTLLSTKKAPGNWLQMYILQGGSRNDSFIYTSNPVTRCLDHVTWVAGTVLARY